MPRLFFAATHAPLSTRRSLDKAHSQAQSLRPPTDYANLSAAFKEDGVIAVKAGEDLTKGGAVILDENGFMKDLVEKGALSEVPPNAYYNAGIYLLTPSIFDFTGRLEKSPRGEYEFTDALKAGVKAGARLRGVILRRNWARSNPSPVRANASCANWFAAA